MKKKSFIVHEKWIPMFLDAPAEDVGSIFKAMMRYTTTGDIGDVQPMHKAILSMMIEAYEEDTENYNAVCEKRRKAVEKRWADYHSKQENTDEYKCIQKNTNVYESIQTDTDKDMDMDMVLDKDMDLEKDKGLKREDANASKREVRHKYGLYENVLLSDSDMVKLKAEFPTDWEERIERLSEYIESKGVKYKNHLATIRAWARKNGDNKKKDNRPYGFRVIDDMDWGNDSNDIDGQWEDVAGR